MEVHRCASVLGVLYDDGIACSATVARARPKRLISYWPKARTAVCDVHSDVSTETVLVTVLLSHSRFLVLMDVGVRIAEDIPILTVRYIPARTTSFLQTDLFATLLAETAGEHVDRTRVDTHLSALKRRISVGSTERGWRHLRVVHRRASTREGSSENDFRCVEK